MERWNALARANFEYTVEQARRRIGRHGVLTAVAGQLGELQGDLCQTITLASPARLSLALWLLTDEFCDLFKEQPWAPKNRSSGRPNL